MHSGIKTRHRFTTQWELLAQRCRSPVIPRNRALFQCAPMLTHSHPDVFKQKKKVLLCFYAAEAAFTTTVGILPPNSQSVLPEIQNSLMVLYYFLEIKYWKQEKYSLNQDRLKARISSSRLRFESCMKYNVRNNSLSTECIFLLPPHQAWKDMAHQFKLFQGQIVHHKLMKAENHHFGVNQSFFLRSNSNCDCNQIYFGMMAGMKGLRLPLPAMFPIQIALCMLVYRGKKITQLCRVCNLTFRNCKRRNYPANLLM